MRAFLISALLAVVVAAGGAIGLGLWKPTLEHPWPWPRSIVQDENGSTPEQKQKFKPGAPLYKPKKAFAPIGNAGLRGGGPDPVVIPGCHLVVFKKQIVGCPKEGMVMFVGQSLTPDMQLLDEMEIAAFRKKYAKQYAERIVNDVPVQFGDAKKYFIYKNWAPGNLVKRLEMVGMLNPAMAIEDVGIAELAVHVAESEERAAQHVQKETIAQLALANRLFNMGSISAEERRLKELAVKRTAEDLITKGKMILRAKRELDKAKTILKKHEIRNMMGGRAVIKAIYKQRGEDAKAQEPIMELHNIELLRAEGLMDGGYLSHIERARDQGRNPRISVEPVYEERPRVCKGHQGVVTSVAVSHHPSPFVVSASTDKTIRLWNSHGGPVDVIDAPDIVRVVACAASADGKRHFCLAGCDDGSLLLYDLTKVTVGQSKTVPRWSKKSPHLAGGITALAFSPDGAFFASGGEDGDIVVWQTETGKDLYTLGAKNVHIQKHDGPITALHFTPESQLVSASSDKSLRVWNMFDNGATLARRNDDRGGSVPQLGVSENGRYMLLDQGRKLQLLSVATGRMMSELASPAATTSFETLAKFSPDAKLILTSSTADGSLQLWKTPGDHGRGSQLLDYVTKESQPVTCAAFAPSAGRNSGESFAVSGSGNGYVYLWRVPVQKEVENHAIRNLKLDLEDRNLASGNQIRIGVNVPNPPDQRHKYGRLVPGSRVTIVIEP